MKLMTRLSLCGLLAALGIVVGSTYVEAQDTVSANSGDWSDPLNWNNGVPTNNWAAINSGHTLDVTPGAVVGLLDVGGTGNGNLTIATGADLNAVAFRVGQAGGVVGSVTQTGGTVSANGALGGNFLEGDILIGDAGKGTWTITDGTLTAQDEFLIGFINASEGTLNVEGGTVNATRILTVGVIGNGKGTLNVSGGTVNASADLVSSLLPGTTSTVDVSGGVVNVTRDWLSARDPGTVSTITQSGGTINVGQHFIHGLKGSATYTQTGGALNVTGANSRLTVAEADTSASYDLQDGSITSTHIFLGDFDNSHGTMKVSGGSITLAGNLNVGGALASNADPDGVRSGDQGQALGAVGNLVVSGSAGAINVGGDLLANAGDKTRPGLPNQSTLTFELFDNSGTSLIDVASAADLDGALIDLDLMGGYTPAFNQSFTLLTALAGIGGDTGTGTTKSNGSTGEAFTLAVEDAANWILSVRSNGSLSESLVATYVPEPTSLALLGIGAMGLLWRSRKRSSN